MSFYLKYRPRKIADLDLVKVREGLAGLVKADRIPQALLFVGPRGGGKTSAARIIAKAINCQKPSSGEPCLECELCRSIEAGSAVDVIEMDAASNRGIEAIRELRDKVNLAPVSGKVKVYIVDEVHMLTTEAFNALLKTLEEPPRQVYFVLCTTEEHKVPETILSRCTKVVFSKASCQEVRSSLGKVVSGEGVVISDEAIELLASGVDGSFREGHKLLEVLTAGGGKIDRARVEEVLGRVVGERVVELANLLVDGDVERSLLAIRQLEEAGVNWLSLVRQLAQELRERMRQQVSPRLLAVVKRIAQAALEMKMAVIEPLPLEIAAVELGATQGDLRGKAQIDKQGAGLPAGRQVSSKTLLKSEDEQESSKVGSVGKEDKIQRQVTGQPATLAEVVEKWGELLKNLAPKNHSVAGLLRATKPKSVEGGALTLEVFYAFHKEQLEQESKRRLLEEALSELLGLATVRLVLGERADPRQEDRRLTQTVQEVFGV